MTIELFNPSLYEVFGEGSALGINHQYTPLAGDSWADADTYATEESAFLGQFQDNPDLFEEARDEDYENDGEPDSLYPLDLGIAGLVHFLSAAGMVPISSCNGRDGHAESQAVVAFASDASRLSVLEGIVSNSSCDLFFEGYGDGNLVVVQSEDWHDLQELGKRIAREREAFSQCPASLTFEDFEEDSDSERTYFTNQLH